MSRLHFAVKTQQICLPLVFLPESKNKPLVSINDKSSALYYTST